MAMRILSTRLLTNQSNNVPLRVCSMSASSSSSSTPAKTTASSSSVQSKTFEENPVPKKESLRSKLAGIFGGNVDPADPNHPPIPASKANFPNTTDHATGEEKLFLLAFENGVLDPYCNLPTDRKGRGTRDNPVTVESFSDERIVACVCEDTQNYVKYTTLHRGEPKRCQCGHWMELVEAPRFWEKIPKEDLVQITFFRELEEEGKLDKFLETGKLEDDHGHHGDHGHGHEQQAKLHH